MLKDKLNTIILGDSYEVLKTFPDNSIDSVVCDPPYGLSNEPDISKVLMYWLNDKEYKHPSKGFMGKDWDSFVPSPLLWKEVFRVLKPGGHILCFAGTRTQDLMTIALRLAGFEIRDVLEWLYLNGFPKSMDVSKAFDKRDGFTRTVVGQRFDGKGTDSGSGCYNMNNGKSTMTKIVDITIPSSGLAKKWEGWGTTLKPAHEPIILGRKPLVDSVCNTVEQYGTGAINVDACRIGDTKITTNGRGKRASNVPIAPKSPDFNGETHTGRFPANCITVDNEAWFSEYFNVTPKDISKKASGKDRNSNYEGKPIDLEEKATGHGNLQNTQGFERFDTKNSNFHPTVKPIELMAWLIKLITPSGGIVLDPFCGSGSTPTAAKKYGFDYIAIEKEPDYHEIAVKRVA